MEWSRGRLLVYVIQAGAGDAMTDKKTPDEALDGIDESKRRTLTRLALGAAFVTPIVASFSIDGLTISKVHERRKDLQEHLLATRISRSVSFCFDTLSQCTKKRVRQRQSSRHRKVVPVTEQESALRVPLHTWLLHS